MAAPKLHWCLQSPIEMTMLKKAFLAAALSLLSAVASADPITYSISRTVGAGTVVGTVVTNGALGVLTAADITGYELTLSAPTISGGSVLVSGASSVVFGNAFTATASGLSFDFSEAGAVVAFATVQGAWCMAGAGATCFGEPTPAETLLAGMPYSIAATEARSGPATVGLLAGSSTTPVPEPTTLALAGLALLALGVRRRA